LAQIVLWCEILRNLVIQITFIVRFAGDTEAEIAGLLDWLHEARIDRVGAFTYSPLEDAPANDIAADVLPEV
jgi:ribosomal protein S12 methylthiotransferase